MWQISEWNYSKETWLYPLVTDCIKKSLGDINLKAMFQRQNKIWPIDYEDKHLFSTEEHPSMDQVK